MLPFYEDETAAIHRRDPEAARAACVGRSYLMAQTMLAELAGAGCSPRPTTSASRVRPLGYSPTPSGRVEPSLAL